MDNLPADFDYGLFESRWGCTDIDQEEIDGLKADLEYELYCERRLNEIIQAKQNS